MKKSHPKLIFYAALAIVCFSIFPNQTIAQNGLAWDGQYLWSSSGQIIYQIDPWASVGNRVIQTFTWGPGQVRWRDLTWDGDYLWAASWADSSGTPASSKIYKIDPLDGSEVFSFAAPFPNHANGMAWDGAYLWIGEERHRIYSRQVKRRSLGLE